MKRHGGSPPPMAKRFRTPYSSDRGYTPERPPPTPSPSPSQSSTSSYGGYSYQSQMWVDPRSDPKHHPNMNMFQPQNMLVYNLYNPMQPPPPLPLERPPVHDTPPPPPPMNHRRSMMNNNMGRRPMNPFRPDNRSYMNLGPYKKNMNHVNHLNHQNHNNHNNHNNHHGPNPNHHGPNKNGHHMHTNSNQHAQNSHNGPLSLPSTSTATSSAMSSTSSTGSGTATPRPNEPKTEDEKPKPTLKVNKKARRKPMSERYTCKKEWNKEDAIKALTLENAYNHLIKKVPMLILRFPDPELNKALIHSYSSAIETVHFQQPSRARYCFVQLKPDADIEQVKKDIAHIEFGTGKISVENKITRHEVSEVTPEQLDPYTLYVGNLPTKLNVTIFKEKFPTAKRIDIGYAQRTKFTRYAFLHYDSVEDSMDAFKTTYNLTIDARSLVVRFRRNKGSVGLSEKGKKAKKDEEGADGEKKEKKVPSGTPLFDDEMVDSKANVKDQSEKLIKQGFGTETPTSENVSEPSIKQEPVSEEEWDDEDADGEEEEEENDGYFGSGNDYSDENEECGDNEEIGDNEECSYNEDGENVTNSFGSRHWERSDIPMVVKTEKPDTIEENLVDESVDVGLQHPKPTSMNQGIIINPEINQLFDELNPEDGLQI